MNLELALRAADRLGGHIVQGHVDGLGDGASVREDGFARVVTIAAAPELLRYVVEKGSIAVDGVSLTVARVDDACFDVSLIPETLERTNLGAADAGRRVNLEVDVLAKYVEKLLGSAVEDAATRSSGRYGCPRRSTGRAAHVSRDRREPEDARQRRRSSGRARSRASCSDARASRRSEVADGRAAAGVDRAARLGGVVARQLERRGATR